MTRLSILVTTLLLASCGIKGSLATPPPLFGSPDVPEEIELNGEPLSTDLDPEGEEDADGDPFFGPDFDDPLLDDTYADE